MLRTDEVTDGIGDGDRDLKSDRRPNVVEEPGDDGAYARPFQRPLEVSGDVV